MKTVFCTNEIWPVYMAYCRGKGLLFRLFGGGWKDTFYDEVNNRDIQMFKVWACDAEALDSLAKEVG